IKFRFVNSRSYLIDTGNDLIVLDILIRHMGIGGNAIRTWYGKIRYILLLLRCPKMYVTRIIGIIRMHFAQKPCPIINYATKGNVCPVYGLLKIFLRFKE